MPISARWGASLDRLTAGHPAGSIIGNYLGQLAAAIVLILSSDRIIFGGVESRDVEIDTRSDGTGACVPWC